MIPERNAAWALLCRYNQSEALRKHALTVEGVMRYFAAQRGGDPDLWGIVGLLHDLDYEQFPQEHCVKGMELMRAEGLDEVIVRGCASHGHGICIDLEPQSDMEKVLYTVDELTGLITAAAIMRPSKSVMDLELKSVKKKYKARSFAAGCNRDVIERGAEMIGLDLDTLIDLTIQGMKTVAGEIGLAGEQE